MNDLLIRKSPIAKTADMDCDRFAKIGDSDMLVRRRLLIATSTIAGAGLAASAIPFIESMEPSAKAEAEGGPTKVNLGALRPGELITAVWRGKPVWILKRDGEMLESIQHDRALLDDPDSSRSAQPVACRNAYRSLQPDLAVIVGVCTHLGCSPHMFDASAAGTGSLGADWPGGFFCPCHGSKFDFAGRVFKNVPAPINLEIPPYAYVSQTLVRIGAERAA